MLGFNLDLGRGHVMGWRPVLEEGSPHPSLSCAPPPALLSRGIVLPFACEGPGAQRGEGGWKA